MAQIVNKYSIRFMKKTNTILCTKRGTSGWVKFPMKICVYAISNPITIIYMLHTGELFNLNQFSHPFGGMTTTTTHTNIHCCQLLKHSTPGSSHCEH